jgi:dipeptidyl aminopeptidase/acylaminoacyl peptidase
MSLKTRRILFIFFILLFITITPLVIFYAAGYELSFKNIKKGGFQKTGMLVLDTVPPGAKIYLNGKPQQLFFKKYFSGGESFVSTPAKIKNIAPGEYIVKMEKDGYSPWEKKLSVFSGMSAYAEDVSLFKKSLPLLAANGKIKNVSYSPDKRYLAAVQDEKINIIDTDKNVLLTINTEKSASGTNEILWSPDSKKIMAERIIYNTANGSIEFNLKQATSDSLDIKWGENNDEIFYIKKTKGENLINSFNLTTKEEKSILKEKEIMDFIIKAGRLYYISRGLARSDFKAAEISSGKIISSIELPYSSEYEFINPVQELINLIDKKHQTLYLIDPFPQFPLKETINNVKYTDWNEGGKLLYGNDFEIWLFDLNSRQNILLTRISETINNIFWHPNNNYIIYLTGDTVNALELDDREKRNLTEIVRLDKISDIFLNKKGDALYFVSQIGNEEGLFKLIIQ